MPTFRLAAIDALGQIGDSSAVDALSLQTWDETLQVRWVTAMALGRIGSTGAVASLARLLADEDARVRDAALFALEQIDENWRDLPDVDFVMRRLRQDLMQDQVFGEEAAIVRVRALDAIDAVDPDWRQGELAEAIVMHWCRWVIDGNDNEREVAARVLGDLKDQRSVSVLEIAMDDVDFGVRRQAIRALGKVGDDRVTGRLKVKLTGDDRYVRVLNDRSSSVVWGVAQALGKLKEPRAVDALVAKLGSNLYSDRTIVKAFDVLDIDWRERPDAKTKIGRLIETYHSQKDMRRITAAMRLAEIGGAQAREVLMEALRQRDLKVLAAAYPFFIRQHTLSTTSAIIQALEYEGDARMAGAMLASGKSRLAKAARRWAYARGMALVSPPESKDDSG